MDVNQYLKNLSANTKSTLELVSSYSNEELLFKKKGECSIAEILEHICISDDKTIRLLQSSSDKIASDSELYGDEKLKKNVVDDKSSSKITGPEIKELKGAVTDFSSFEKIFLPQRILLYDSLQLDEITISNRVYEHPYLKEMTVIDWLKYIIYHTTRHLNDIIDSSSSYRKQLS